MSETSQADTRTELVHSVDMIHPFIVYDSYEDHSFELSHTFFADLSFLFIVKLCDLCVYIFMKLLRRNIRVITVIRKGKRIAELLY